MDIIQLLPIEQALAEDVTLFKSQLVSLDQKRTPKTVDLIVSLKPALGTPPPADLARVLLELKVVAGSFVAFPQTNQLFLQAQPEPFLNWLESAEASRWVRHVGFDADVSITGGPEEADFAVAALDSSIAAGPPYAPAWAGAIRLDGVHRRNRHTNRSCVAILDSGLDATPPVFANATVREFADFDRFGNKLATTSPDDAGCHGTKVAALIVRCAPAVELVVLRVMDGPAKGEKGRIARIIGGINWLISEVLQGNHPVVVANMSFEYTQNPAHRDVAPLLLAITTLKTAGVLPVLPVGNSGRGQTSILGQAVGALRVGASNGLGVACHFTNPGADLVAPGEAIRCDQPLSVGAPSAVYDGTSLSAAIVTGTVACLSAASGNGRSADDLANALKRGAKERSQWSTPNPVMGWGELDAGRSLDILDNENPVAPA